MAKANTATEKVATKTSVELEDGSKETREAEVEVYLGGDLDSAVEAYGPENVYEMFRRGARLFVQSTVRQGLVAGADRELIQRGFPDGKIDFSTSGRSKDPVTSILGGFNELDEEAQLEMLQRLQERLAARQA